jgi:hypothetical protein
MDLCSLAVIIVYLFTPKKSKPMGWLALLAMASLMENLIANYVDIRRLVLKTSPLTLAKISEPASIYLYLAIEVTCCLLFIKSYLRTGAVKRLLLLGNFLFVTCSITYWRLHPFSNTYPWYITFSEGFLVIAGALSYFFELFSYNRNLGKEPSLWAISGMLVLFSAITPLFLLFNYLRSINETLVFKLYAINNVAYSILFITFSVTMILDKKQKEQRHALNNLLLK